MNQPQLSEELIEELKTYSSLASRVKELSSSLSLALDDQQRVSILKQLAVAIYSFDGHVKMMLNKFPEYYSDKKGINTLIIENDKFLNSTLNELRLLSNNPN